MEIKPKKQMKKMIKTDKIKEKKRQNKIHLKKTE